MAPLCPRLPGSQARPLRGGEEAINAGLQSRPAAGRGAGGGGAAGCLRPTLTCLARCDAGLQQKTRRPTRNSWCHPQHCPPSTHLYLQILAAHRTHYTPPHIRTAPCNYQKAFSGSFSIDAHTKPRRWLGRIIPILEEENGSLEFSDTKSWQRAEPNGTSGPPSPV